MMPVVGAGVALALIGWIYTGLAVIAVAIIVPRLIKRSAPHFVLTQALQDARVYDEAVRAAHLALLARDGFHGSLTAKSARTQRKITSFTAKRRDILRRKDQKLQLQRSQRTQQGRIEYNYMILLLFSSRPSAFRLFCSFALWRPSR